MREGDTAGVEQISDPSIIDKCKWIGNIGNSTLPARYRTLRTAPVRRSNAMTAGRFGSATWAHAVVLAGARMAGGGQPETNDESAAPEAQRLDIGGAWICLVASLPTASWGEEHGVNII